MNQVLECVAIHRELMKLAEDCEFSTDPVVYGTQIDLLRCIRSSFLVPLAQRARFEPYMPREYSDMDLGRADQKTA